MKRIRALSIISFVLLCATAISNADYQVWGWQGAGTAGNTATDPADPTTQWNVVSNWGGSLPEAGYMDVARIKPINAGYIYAATGNFYSVQIGGTSSEAALYVTEGVNFTSSMLLVGIGTLAEEHQNQLGKVVQTGGLVNIGVNSLSLGFNPDGQGTYELRDGSLTTTGGLICGRQGSGFFIQTGGLVTADRIDLGFNFGSSGNYELRGGRLIAENIYMTQNANFAFTGGILDIEATTYTGLTNTGGILAVRRFTHIDGDYIQTNGTLEMTLSEGFNDRLDLLGGVNITGGNLDIVLDNGYVPNIGDTFTIITQGSDSMDINFESITNGYRIYNEGTNVILQVVPEPCTILLLGFGGLALRNRRGIKHGRR